ncbi:DUF2264 domain-containing protein [Lapidilactobacillus luobeiensis]|uniref:DUF2264 domain-containing protein n=1 Tax=Lapidilactobacillus luobeiensis TaxID=2950371 RepID=UPI0021C39ABC|nr:DUF2264 domain-containing protein [Lapidilactobacillus luobeiensis]
MVIDSRTALYDYFEKLNTATRKYRRPHNGRFDFGTTATHYDENQIQIEAFLRQLWAIGPLAGQHLVSAADWDFYADAIVHSVDPADPAYWGKVQDFDQLLVEMTPLAVTLIETKAQFWDRLAPRDQQNIYRWLDQINQVQVHPNNWRFFRVLVNVAFLKLGLPVDQEKMTADQNLLDTFYLKDGWYFDGNPHQQDYYIPWAFHYYGLLYAHYMGQEDPQRAKRYRQRAIAFARSFKYWFDRHGVAVAFGRSLIYRFAQSAFWSACVFANVEAVPWAEMRTLLLGNLTDWSQRPIQKSDGILSLGYGYENFEMTEHYNGPGSPYWGFKTMIVLATAPQHPFWQAQTAPKLGLHDQELIAPAKMIVTHQQDLNTQLYPADQLTGQLHCGEKYSKLVYSADFGFSVSRGNDGIAQFAGDNCLAVAEVGTENFVSKQAELAYDVNAQRIKHRWSPLPEVLIESIVVPLGPWHIRYHRIQSQRALKYVDGGFSNKIKNGHESDYQFDQIKQGLSFHSTIGVTASVAYQGYHEVTPIFTEPNTNLLFPNSLYLGASGEMTAGEQVLLSAHYGGVAPVTTVPTVTLQAGQLRIQYQEQVLVIEC